MPSGYTHCILARRFNEESGHSKTDLKFLLNDKVSYFQVGAMGPDLPYSQIPRILNDQEKIADDFHYKDTNHLVLEAFKAIKGMEPGDNQDEAFSFFLGFASHIVADGVIHPFIRDKVGNYLENATAHRVLEMKIDVLLMHEYSKRSGLGINLNTSDYHNQIKDVLAKDFGHVSGLFANLINRIYQKSINASTVEDWIDDMHDMFEIAENKHNQYYSKFPKMKDFLFKDIDEVIQHKDEILILKKHGPKDRPQNFAGRDIHFINDCIPMFYKLFTPFALKAFLFVYEGGPELKSEDFPAINLDTGRSLAANAGNDLDQDVVYWS